MGTQSACPGRKDLIRYKAFYKIVETGSFTKAAEALGYTQAAVSQMMRILEAELKLSLFVRMRTGIKLTPEGEALYPIIKKIVMADRELADKANELYGLETGEIRIGTFSSISQNLMPSLLKKFSEQYPGVKFVLRQGDNATIPDMIRSGAVDFGFLYPSAARGLIMRAVSQDCFLAVLPEEHPLAGKSELTLADLAKESLIMLDEGNIYTTETAFESVGLKPNLKYLVHDDYTILAMIEEGLGIGVLPAAILRHTNYHFNAIPINPPITRTLGIAYQSEELLPVAAKRFIDFMCDYISEYTAGSYTLVDM